MDSNTKNLCKGLIDDIEQACDEIESGLDTNEVDFADQVQSIDEAWAQLKALLPGDHQTDVESDNLPPSNENTG